jgi:Xaa-Pro dipeptidase
LVKPKADNPFLRNTSIITPGQVFTIEPGIYFVDRLLDELRQGEHSSSLDWKLVDALAAFGGVRIEDDVVVTGGASAIRNLTREVLPIGGGLAN